MRLSAVRHALIMLLGTSMYTLAQAQRLDLSQAYAAALARDASLQASRAAADAGREALPQARARLLPDLSASATRSKNQLISTAPDLTGTPQTHRDGYLAGNASLTLRQPIYRPLAHTGLQQAQARVNASEATLERDLQALAVRVAQAYFELLLANDQIALVDTQQRAFKTQLDAANKAFGAGSGTRTDIDEVQARLDMSEAQALEARQHRQLAHRQLQAMIGESFDSIAPLDVRRLDLRAPQPDDLNHWLALAEDHNPEIKTAQAQLEAARLEVDKARAGHRPTLDAFAEWSRSDSDNINRIGSRYTTKTVGLQLLVPLFSGGGVNSVVRQALAEEQRAAQTLEALRRDLANRLYTEFAGVTGGVLRVRALEQAVRSAEQMVRSNRRSFQAGSRTTIDILDAEQQQMSALRDLAQARYVYLMSRVRLWVLAGTFDAQRLREINLFFSAATPVASTPLLQLH